MRDEVIELNVSRDSCINVDDIVFNLREIIAQTIIYGFNLYNEVYSIQREYVTDNLINLQDIR